MFMDFMLEVQEGWEVRQLIKCQLSFLLTAFKAVLHFHVVKSIKFRWLVLVVLACFRPFPSLPRLHRHIKEKHLNTSAKSIYPNQRSK